MVNLLTTAEAASIAGVKRGTILAWIYRGKLKSVKRGRDHLILRSDLEKMERRSAGRPTSSISRTPIKNEEHERGEA